MNVKFHITDTDNAPLTLVIEDDTWSSKSPQAKQRLHLNNQIEALREIIAHLAAYHPI